MGKSETPQLDLKSFADVKNTVKAAGIDVKDKVQMSDANIVMKVNKAWADKYKDHPLSKKIQGFAKTENAEEAVQKIKDLQKQLGLKGDDVDGIMGFKTAGLYEKRDTKKDQDEAKTILADLEGVQKKDKQDRLSIDTTADGSSTLTTDGIQLAKEAQEERTEKLAKIENEIQSDDKPDYSVTELRDLNGDKMEVKKDGDLKYAIGTEGINKGKVFDTKTGTYSEQTEVQMLAANKTKSEKEATGKKVEELVTNIQDAATAGDSSDYIQGYLNALPADTKLTEKQLADINTSLKEKGLQVEQTVDFDTNIASYKMRETELGSKKEYEDKIAQAKNLTEYKTNGNIENLLDYRDNSKEPTKDGQKIGDMKLSELTSELINGKHNGLPQDQRDIINSIINSASEGLKKDTTLNDYFAMIQNPNKAALALAPDKPGVLPGKLGEWGVKYQKGSPQNRGENMKEKTFAYREGKAPTVIDADGKEKKLTEVFSTAGVYTLPDGQIYEVKDATNGSKIAYKKDTASGEFTYAVSSNGTLEKITKTV